MSDFSTRLTVWAGATIAFALAFATLLAAELTPSVAQSVSTPVSIVTGLVAGAVYRRCGTWLDRVVDAIECVALLALVALSGGVASYAISALTTGYVDNGLAAIDGLLGFSWPTAWRVAHQDATLFFVLHRAYSSIVSFPTIMVAALVLLGNADRAYRFLLAFGIALALTDVIFLATPARSAAAFYLGVGAPMLEPVHFAHIAVIDGLRAGTTTTVPLDHIIGLITFPSFHAASAILFIWACWPSRWLRAPALAINLTMLVATPALGSHYLIDLLGGVLVAIVGIAAAPRLLAWAAARLQPISARRAFA